MKNRSEMDLTHGNLFVKVVRFCLPLMLTTIFQLLYTTIDLWTVSNYGGGSLSMTAIGSNGALINLIVGVLVALAVGSNVAISVAKGANDREKASRILHTAFVIAVVGGVVFGVIGYFCSPILLRLMDTPESIIGKATQYLQIYFLGCPLMITYNFGSQMLRALGDSKRPLMMLIIAGIVNVFFDLLFVIKFGMDVKGVAIATVISQGVSAVLVVLWFTFNKSCFVNFSLRKFRAHKQELLEILKIGIPSGLQSLAFSFPNVLIQSSLYTIQSTVINGVTVLQNDIVSGSSASTQLEGYVFAGIDAFTVGAISVVGQNYGARKPDNIRKTFWYAISWMSIFWGICALFCGLFPDQLLSIFVTESDGINVQHALLAGKERMFLMVFTYVLDGVMGIFSGYLRGMKQATVPAIFTIVGCTGTRILFLLTLFKTEFFHTVQWLYAVYPISWVLINLAYIPYTLAFQKKVFAKLNEQSSTVETQDLSTTAVAQ